MLNYARPLIYSTSLSRPSVAAIHAAYELMESDVEVCARRSRLLLLSEHFRRAVASSALPSNALIPGAKHHIVGILVPGSERCMQVAAKLQERGFGVLAVRAPTVPSGSERIRVIVHSYNVASVIDELVFALVDVLGKDHAVTPMVAKL